MVSYEKYSLTFRNDLLLLILNSIKQNFILIKLFNPLPVIMSVIVKYRQMGSSLLEQFKHVRDYNYCIVFPSVSVQVPFRQEIL